MKKIIDISTDYKELHNNVIIVEKWQRKMAMKTASIIVLFFAVAGLLLTLAVSIGSIGNETIDNLRKVEENGLQRP